MKQVVKDVGKKIILKEVAEPVVKEGFVKIKTHYSLISSGTETRVLTESESFLKSMLKKGKALAKGSGNENAVLGYCTVGEVIDKGADVREMQKGDRVVCSGFGYAMHAEKVIAPKNLVCKIPLEVAGEEAAFTAIASVALHAVRRCNVQLGEMILVVGLGLTGQLTAQLLRLSGCRVIGLDRNEYKTDLALSLGADEVLQGNKNVKETIMQWTQQQGVDGVIYCADIQEADQFEEVASSLRDKGRIVTIGHVKTTIPTAILFRKEIDLLACRSFGPGRFDKQYEEQGQDFPIGYVRWTEKRNMEEIIRLIQQKKLQIKPLISEKYFFTDAPKAYKQLLEKKRPIAIVLEYQK